MPAGSTAPETEPLSSPDDITLFDHHLFTTFQNGVGPQGQPSADGNTDSTIVEYTEAGTVINQWDLVGKCDGLTAERAHRSAGAGLRLQRAAAAFRRHRCDLDRPRPGAGERVRAGHDGAAAPQPTCPAIYSVTFDAATVTPLFYDEASAIDANVGPFRPGQVYTAVTPCDANDAPATCPAPGFPPNYLGTLNPWTGVLTAVPLAGAPYEPQGMIFVGR